MWVLCCNFEYSSTTTLINPIKAPATFRVPRRNQEISDIGRSILIFHTFWPPIETHGRIVGSAPGHCTCLRLKNNVTELMGCHLNEIWFEATDSFDIQYSLAAYITYKSQQFGSGQKLSFGVSLGEKFDHGPKMANRAGESLPQEGGFESQPTDLVAFEGFLADIPTCTFTHLATLRARAMNIQSNGDEPPTATPLPSPSPSVNSKAPRPTLSRSKTIRGVSKNSKAKSRAKAKSKPKPKPKTSTNPPTRRIFNSIPILPPPPPESPSPPPPSVAESAEPPALSQLGGFVEASRTTLSVARVRKRRRAIGGSGGGSIESLLDSIEPDSTTNKSVTDSWNGRVDSNSRTIAGEALHWSELTMDDHVAYLAGNLSEERKRVVFKEQMRYGEWVQKQAEMCVDYKTLNPRVKSYHEATLRNTFLDIKTLPRFYKPHSLIALLRVRTLSQQLWDGHEHILESKSCGVVCVVGYKKLAERKFHSNSVIQSAVQRNLQRVAEYHPASEKGPSNLTRDECGSDFVIGERESLELVGLHMFESPPTSQDVRFLLPCAVRDGKLWLDQAIYHPRTSIRQAASSYAQAVITAALARGSERVVLGEAGFQNPTRCSASSYHKIKIENTLILALAHPEFAISRKDQRGIQVPSGGRGTGEGVGRGGDEGESTCGFQEGKEARCASHCSVDIRVHLDFMAKEAKGLKNRNPLRTAVYEDIPLGEKRLLALRKALWGSKEDSTLVVRAVAQQGFQNIHIKEATLSGIEDTDIPKGGEYREAQAAVLKMIALFKRILKLPTGLYLLDLFSNPGSATILNQLDPTVVVERRACPFPVGPRQNAHDFPVRIWVQSQRRVLCVREQENKSEFYVSSFYGCTASSPQKIHFVFKRGKDPSSFFIEYPRTHTSLRQRSQDGYIVIDGQAGGKSGDLWEIVRDPGSPGVFIRHKDSRRFWVLDVNGLLRLAPLETSGGEGLLVEAQGRSEEVEKTAFVLEPKDSRSLDEAGFKFKSNLSRSDIEGNESFEGRDEIPGTFSTSKPDSFSNSNAILDIEAWLKSKQGGLSGSYVPPKWNPTFDHQIPNTFRPKPNVESGIPIKFMPSGGILEDFWDCERWRAQRSCSLEGCKLRHELGPGDVRVRTTNPKQVLRGKARKNQHVQRNSKRRTKTRKKQKRLF
ncbi:hypothetical protein AAMO2058_000657600 [Amorphochlora amoebiformis]